MRCTTSDSASFIFSHTSIMGQKRYYMKFHFVCAWTKILHNLKHFLVTFRYEIGHKWSSMVPQIIQDFGRRVFTLVMCTQIRRKKFLPHWMNWKTRKWLSFFPTPKAWHFQELYDPCILQIRCILCGKVDVRRKYTVLYDRVMYTMKSGVFFLCGKSDVYYVAKSMYGVNTQFYMTVCIVANPMYTMWQSRCTA